VRALQEAVLVVVVYLANLNSAEIVAKIFVAHPEGAVAGVILEANLLFYFRSPTVG